MIKMEHEIFLEGHGVPFTMYSADYKDPLCINKSNLKETNIDNVKRLAKWLDLNINGMSDRQIINLVWWRITRHHKRKVDDLW